MCISPEDAPKGAKPEEGDVSGLRRGTRPPNEADPVPRMVSRGAIRGLLGRESSRPKPSGENVAVQHRDSHVRSGRLGARCPGRQTGPLSKAAARDKASDPKSSHKTLRVKIVRPAVLYRRWMNTKKRKKKQCISKRRPRLQRPRQRQPRRRRPRRRRPRRRKKKARLASHKCGKRTTGKCSGRKTGRMDSSGARRRAAGKETCSKKERKTKAHGHISSGIFPR